MAQPLNTSCSNDKSLIHLDPIIIHWDSTWIHKVLRQQLNRARNGFIASSSQGDPATTSTWPCWSQHLKRNRPNHGTAMWPSPNQSDRWIQCGLSFALVSRCRRCRSWAHPVYTRWARCDWRWCVQCMTNSCYKVRGLIKQKTTAVL